MYRPSERELYKKIEEARGFLENQKGLFANPAKAVGELAALEIEDTRSIWTLTKELLDEIKPEDYAGSRPPQKSYEKTVEGRELFAFSWMSKKLDKQMYLKFALKNDRYYYVSLHECKVEALK